MNFDIIKWIVLALLLWNLIVFFIFGIDKAKAKKRRWRISEHTLLTCAFLLGSLGGLCGMKLFHHKTLHKKFYIGLPLMLVFHIFILILFIYYFH